MSGRKKLRKAIREFSDRKQDQNPILSGRLGTLIDGHQIVEVSDRPGFVWVRVRGSESELIQAYNATVSPIYDLPFLYFTGDEWAYVGATGTLPIAPNYNPTGTSSGRMVLLYLNREAGTFGLVGGSEFPSSSTGITEIYS